MKTCHIKDNVWTGDTKEALVHSLDEQANPQQWEALQMIFSSKASGFIAEFIQS